MCTCVCVCAWVQEKEIIVYSTNIESTYVLYIRMTKQDKVQLKARQGTSTAKDTTIM